MTLFILLMLFVVAAIFSSAARAGRKAGHSRPKRKLSDEEFIARLASIPGAKVHQRGDQTIINIGGAPETEETHSRLPEITWEKLFQPPEKCRVEYVDRFGNETERVVFMARRGIATNGHEYVGIYEDGKFKTLRADRIREIEITDG